MNNKNRQSDYVSKRNERVGEKKHRKRDRWVKNRQSEWVSKRNERIGVRTSDKQKEVRNLINDEKLQICGIIETHIKYNNNSKIGEKVFGKWDFISNSEDNNQGCRIMIGWNPNKIRVWLIAKTKQWDFNVSLKVEEHSNGSSTITNEMNEFLEVIKDIEVEDILSSGFHYTWTKSRMNPKCKTLKKLDRIMINEDFMEKFPSSHGIFLPYLISDHSPVVLKIPKGMKAKIEWLRDGDRNTSFFHKIIKGRKYKGRIMSVCNVKGDRFENEKVAEQFVMHFQEFLGKKDLVTEFPTDLMMFPNKLSSDEAFCLSRDVNEVEVKNDMFDINDAKAPGPDGYTTRFYKSAWSVIGKDVCKAVQEFFIKGKLLGEVNATLISLVPKMQNPNKVFDFRPIACCNVIYKCISKIVTNRIKGVLGKLVNKSQSAFIAGRQITDNILLAQELFKGYNRKQKIKRVAFKIDLQKAYDTIDWSFLKIVLEQFGFPERMVNWIMVCVSTTKFSININGEREGYFSDGRGLRQGDPMSPYLFTLIMEVFSLILERNIDRNNEFKYHHGCKNLKITHLCFADDLLVFCHGGGGIKSVSTIKEALEEFSNYSGLKANMITCENVIYDINKLLKGFLWCQGELTKGKAKVSWDSICKPKELGGLGIKDLKLWNEVLLVKQLWNVISKKNTLWVKWVISKNLKGKNIWEANAKVNSSVGWKEILKLRDKIRKHVLWKIRYGNSVNAWYDNWNTAGPLNEIVTFREIYEAGMNIDYTVAQLTMSGEGKWPNGWQDEYPILKMYKIPRLQEGKKDEIVWVDNFGKKGCLEQDSIEHLFFSCNFSKEVWKEMQRTLNVNLAFTWRNIVDELCRLPNNKNIWIIVRKLVFGAVVYFIWQERNKRIFQEEKREEKTLVQIIKETVWLRLADLVVKDSKTIKEVEDRWSVQFLRKKNRMIV
ncbi:RNA-directed DNA polymerase, eukaryota, reverse transcriptase zinc-binding domain protein [Tanacetum coccineum]